MKFKLCIDDSLLIRPTEEHKDILENTLNDKLDIDIDIEVGYRIRLHETIVCYRLDICKQDDPDIVMNCIKYDEYCRGLLHEKAYNEDTNLIVITRKSPIPVQSTEDRYNIIRGRGLTHIFPDGLVVILLEFGADDILPHEIGHAFGLDNCDNDKCLMNRNATNIINSEGLCDKCNSRLERLLSDEV